MQIDASLSRYRGPVKWSAGFAWRRWAVEPCGLTRHLAQDGSSRVEIVEDMPSTATKRVGQLLGWPDAHERC